MQEKKQRKSIGQCKCCGLHFFDDINKEQLCESCSRFIADYTKQVRKEVVKEIKEKLKGKEIFHPEDEFEIDYDFYYKEDVEEILDQLEEYKEKL